MSNLVITITYADVLAQCKRLSAYEGRDAFDSTGRSRYPKIHINTNDEELINDYIYQAESYLRMELDDMITAAADVTPSGSSTVTGTTWTFDSENSRVFGKGQQGKANTYVKEAVCAYVMSMWLSDDSRKPERVSFYRELYENEKALIIQTCFKKASPAFPTSSNNTTQTNTEL